VPSGLKIAGVERDHTAKIRGWGCERMLEQDRTHRYAAPSGEAPT